MCLCFPCCLKKGAYLNESLGAGAQVKALWSCQFEAGYDTTPATENSTSGLHPQPSTHTRHILASPQHPPPTPQIKPPLVSDDKKKRLGLQKALVVVPQQIKGNLNRPVFEKGLCCSNKTDWNCMRLSPYHCRHFSFYFAFTFHLCYTNILRRIPHVGKVTLQG